MGGLSADGGEPETGPGKREEESLAKEKKGLCWGLGLVEAGVASGSRAQPAAGLVVAGERAGRLGVADRVAGAGLAVAAEPVGVARVGAATRMATDRVAVMARAAAGADRLPGLDDRKLAERGGVVGACAFPPIHWDQTDKRPGLETFLDSISYFADLVGVDHIGIGLDSNAQPGAYDRRELLSMGQGQAGVSGPNYYLHFHLKGMTEESFYFEGIVNLANLPNITDGLLKRGFSREETRQILGLNYLRVFEQWWD